MIVQNNTLIIVDLYGVVRMRKYELAARRITSMIEYTRTNDQMKLDYNEKEQGLRNNLDKEIDQVSAYPIIDVGEQCSAADQGFFVYGNNLEALSAATSIFGDMSAFFATCVTEIPHEEDEPTPEQQHQR
eukprot:406690_1